MIAFILLSLTVVALAILVAGFGQRVLNALDRLETPDHGHADGINPTHLGVPIGASPPMAALGLVGADPLRLPSIVTFLERSCGECQNLQEDLARHLVAPPGIELVAIVDDGRSFSKLADIGWRLVEDPTKTVFRAWLVTGTPLAYLISSEAVVVGVDIPNSSEHVANLASLHLGVDPHTAQQEGSHK